MAKTIKFFLSVILCEMVGLLSTPFTIQAIPTWYIHLNKPFFSPPNWVFGPVWTILYFLMGLSLYLIWIKKVKIKKQKTLALRYFWIQLLLNFSWSILFFGLHSPLLGLIDIVLLWMMIFMTIKAFLPISKNAAYFLIPYLLWVTFASLLNLAIAILNL